MIEISVDRGLRVKKSALGKELEVEIRELFTHDNQAFWKAEKLGFWTGNIPRQFDSYDDEGEFLVLPRGARKKLTDFLDKRGLDWETYDHRVELAPVDFEVRAKARSIELYDVQKNLVESAIAKENCLLRAATGSGKTEVALEIIRRLRQPAIVIVWTKSLLEQWVDRICLRWGWKPQDVGVWGGGVKRLGPITIAMQQTLANDLSDLPWRFGTVACDEVQRFAASTFRGVVAAFFARYRIGVSADETRKDRMEFLIHEQFGPVAAEVSKEEMIADGKLCDVEIVLVPTSFSVREVEDAPFEEKHEVVRKFYSKIVGAMEGNDPRNSIAVSIAAEAARRGSSVLVFCNRVAQARELAKRISVFESVPCGLMIGGPENREEFRRSKERLASGELRCAVGSSATYQGEDIPRLNVGVVVTPTAGNRQLFEQQVGRLRRKFPGKVMGRLYVLWDEKLWPQHKKNLLRWYGSERVRVEEV